MRYHADLLAFDAEQDLAVVRIARLADGSPVTDTFTPIPLGDPDAIALGDRLRIIGFPGIGGETVTFTEGSVSGFTTAGGRPVLIKTDATIAGGNSGGLAADDEGTIIGVPTRAGTDDMRIVDCRIITDTNRDGAIDQDDSCVPIGGFINGIRPVSLALPLIDAARTATPIDQGPPPVAQPMGDQRPVALAPQWTLGVTPDGLPAQPVLSAPTGAGELCLTWSYEAVPTGSAFEIVWLYEGEVDPGPGVVGQTSGPDAGAFFACISNPEGLADGLYELAWFIEGEPVFAEATFVGDRAPITVQVVNEVGAEVCVVQFNPTGSRTFGLNHLTEVLAPGATASVQLPAGNHVARVLDCEGVVRFEDMVGTELTADTTLTVTGG